MECDYCIKIMAWFRILVVKYHQLTKYLSHDLNISMISYCHYVRQANKSTKESIYTLWYLYQTMVLTDVWNQIGFANGMANIYQCTYTHTCIKYLFRSNCIILKKIAMWLLYLIILKPCTKQAISHHWIELLILWFQYQKIKTVF